MPDALPRILFVCVENSCRSQMAEGFGRALAGARAEVRSAGSKPSGEVNATAIRLMAERGIDLTTQPSKGLDDLPQGLTWDYVVTMGCGDQCPYLPARHRVDWALPDPKQMDDSRFRAVRDEIEWLVRDLLDNAGVTAAGGSGAEP